MQKTRFKSKLSLILLLAFVACTSLPCSNGSTHEKRVVILIGDGMGFEEIRAAECFNGAPFVIKSRAIYSGSLTTANYSGEVTDSAAGATAMATGEKVSNGVISRRVPGSGYNMTTLFEHARDRYYATGIITTSYIVDATPAAFYAHVESRKNYYNISRCLLISRPDLVIGGLRYLNIADFSANRYTSYNSIDEYGSGTPRPLFIKLGDDTAAYEYDTFMSTGTQAHLLSRSVIAAKKFFDAEAHFMLMAEGGRIDHAGHTGLIKQSVYETNEFFLSADIMHSWLADKGNYLMIIVADHETGGLNVLADNGAGNFPDVEWTSPVESGVHSHTGRDVPVYVYSDLLGPAEVSCIKDNTDIHGLVEKFLDY